MRQPLGCLAVFVVLSFAHQVAHVSGVRASPRPFDTPVGKLKLVGNERSHRLVEVASGYTVVRAPPNSASQPQPPYFYATLDDAGEVVASRYPVGHNLDPTTVPELKRDVITRRIAPNHSGRRLGTHRENRQLSRALASVTGGVVTIKNLVMRLRFADHVNRELPSTTAYTRLMSGVDTRGSCDPILASCSAPTGSVREYFLEQSYGKVDIQSTVTQWIDLPKNESYYGAGCSSLCDKDVRLYGDIVEALRALDVAGTYTWSDFDAVGGGVNGDEPDGVIDMLTFFHSGYGAEWGEVDVHGTAYEDRIWSHHFWLDSSNINAAAFTSASGHKFNRFYINPGLWGVAGTQVCHIGVVVHEACHYFGLPDLYDPDSSSGSLGAFSLMADNWGFDGSQNYPSSLMAWSRIAVGFASAIEVHGTSDIELSDVHTAPHFYKISNGYPAGEYLLVEYRQNVSFDLLQPNSGVLIWKVDNAMNVAGELNSYESYPGSSGWPLEHYFIAMLEADGLYQLQRSANAIGDTGDVWTAGGVLGDLTMPTLNSYELIACRSDETGMTGNEIEIKRYNAASNTYTIRYTKTGDCNCFTTCSNQVQANPTSYPTVPTSPTCMDSPSGWYDGNGAQYNCDWYASDATNRCGSYAEANAISANARSANDACCVCNGGYQLVREPTPAPTAPTSGDATWSLAKVAGVGVGGVLLGITLGRQCAVGQKVTPK